MEIRQGNQSDVQSCLNLARRLREYFNESGLAAMRQDLKHNLLYIATEYDRVLGFAAVTVKNRNVAELAWMAVEPHKQQRGIGTRLIYHVVDELHRAGIELLQVKTLAREAGYTPYDASRRFYEKMGFRHLETIDPYPGWEPGNPCAIYVKALG